MSEEIDPFEAAIDDLIVQDKAERAKIEELKSKTPEKPEESKKAEETDKKAADPADEDAMAALKQMLGNGRSDVSDERLAGLDRMMQDFQQGMALFETLPEGERNALEQDFEESMRANMEQMMQGPEMEEFMSSMANQMFSAESIVPWMSKVAPRFKKHLEKKGGSYKPEELTSYKAQLGCMERILKHYETAPSDVDTAFKLLEELNTLGDMPEDFQDEIADILGEMGMDGMGM
ncbi:Pex19 protein [Carpediemonas membranifera]|uniref:Pex19 protein n=1 Tax=Carpediemonas membranifera TaxID=201153 RepID=A0A8J6C003_9EUKA|nr:Pex19 protein [Carpediemonas membranifera]|eukprot:KAG9396066.1 Pex19 protein [Carpediemonas membranifera]